MNKLTLIFIIVTVLIVSVIGTLLGFRYFAGSEDNLADQGGLGAQEDVGVQTGPPTIPVLFEDIRNEEEDEPEEITPEPTTTPTEAPPAMVDPFSLMEEEEEEEEEVVIPVFPSIDDEKTNTAGFKENILEISEFDGLVFNDFNLAEYNDDDHISYILLSGDEESARITELFFPSLEISDEVYASLKAKMADSGYFTINETNQYGDFSYFANHSTEKNSVFLVVKIKERLYTFHYPAKNHNKIKNLINLL